MMININLLGGPGTGKSTTRAGVFYRMKTDGYKIEEVVEYAKELTYGKEFIRLADQLHLLGEQHHRIYKLKDQVDFIITDSPFIMGLAYLEDSKHIPRELFRELIVQIFKSYNNVNIFLERDVEAHGYQEYGRNQTLEQAKVKDMEIKQILIDNRIPFHVVKMGSNSVEEIYSIVRELN